MRYRLRVLGGPRGRWIGPPVYVESYDVNAYGGRGYVTFTGDPTRAIDWPDPATAAAVHRMQSTLKPVGDDGQPNRPLSRYTMEIEPFQEAGI